MTTNVPSPSFSTSGLVIPEEADILAGVQADINAAFGGTLSSSLETPQGQLATSMTAAIADKNNLLLAYVNQVDPNYSQGRMQDGIGYLYFLERIPATSTVVYGVCTGLDGTLLPAGLARVKDENGNIYVTVQDYYLFPGDTYVAFHAVELGAIACPAHSISIYGAIPGWDTVDNPNAGNIGTNTETQQEFESRRRQSVALNAYGSVPSIFAAVAASGSSLTPANVPADVKVVENDQSIPKTVNGVVLNPHSIYVAVVGGDEGAIAKAIWTKKAPGCGYTGNKTVVYEDQENYGEPYPSYNVTYQVPDSVTIYFKVTLAAGTAVSSSIISAIKTAIVNAFNGTDGGDKARIGSTLYASRYYAAAIGAAPGVNVISVTIGKAVNPTTSYVALYMDQYPTLDSGNINVVTV